MKKKFLPLLTFLGLFLFTSPLLILFSESDMVTSVIPGWHTTLFPPHFLFSIVISIALLLNAISYAMLLRKRQLLNLKLFALHFLLTIPIVLHLNFPFLFLSENMNQNADYLAKEVDLEVLFFKITIISFIVGQIVFWICFMLKIRQKTVN
jgi:hypothetical protein